MSQEFKGLDSHYCDVIRRLDALLQDDSEVTQHVEVAKCIHAAWIRLRNFSSDINHDSKTALQFLRELPDRSPETTKILKDRLMSLSNALCVLERPSTDNAHDTSAIITTRAKGVLRASAQVAQLSRSVVPLVDNDDFGKMVRLVARDSTGESTTQDSTREPELESNTSSPTPYTEHSSAPTVLIDDMHVRCDCRNPDLTRWGTCQGCGNPVDLELLRKRAVQLHELGYESERDLSLAFRSVHRTLIDPSGNLRLLRLCNALQSSEPLSGTFQITSIDEAPDFEAVSYTWADEYGNSELREVIIIDGSVLPITNNCAAALRKLRNSSGEERLLWIDSICINQYDVEEKSGQISLMGNIYSEATKVQVFLGRPSNENSARDAMYILDLSQDLDIIIEYLLKNDRARDAVLELFKAPYFSRFWVIQEMTLANVAKIHWGGASTLWEKLAYERIRALQEGGIGNKIPPWIQDWKGQTRRKLCKDMGQLLFSTMSSKASDPRDKVYGLYGLLADAKAEGLIANYTLTAEQVYIRTATYLINQQNDLKGVLQHAHCDLDPEGLRLPSWVPDFRKATHRKLPALPGQFSYELHIHPETSDKMISVEHSTGELHLGGHVLEIIQDKHESPAKTFSTTISCPDEALSKWEIRANFEIPFDSSNHTIFRLHEGQILHLRNNKRWKGVYHLVGDCTLRSSRRMPSLEVHNQRAYFAEALFPLNINEFEVLWKFYNDLQDIIGRELRFGTNHVGPMERMWEWRDSTSAFDSYRELCSKGTTETAANSDSQTLRPQETKVVRSDLMKMSNFRSFWEDQHTWDALHRLKLILEDIESHKGQHIEEICKRWFEQQQAVEKAAARFVEMMQKRNGNETPENHEIIEILRAHIDLWDAVTGELWEQPHWRTDYLWVFMSTRNVGVFEVPKEHEFAPRDQLTRLKLSRDLSILVKGLFEEMRKRLADAIQTPSSIRGPASIVGDWTHWTKMIQVLQYLPSLKRELNFEGLMALRDDCLKRGAWRKTGMMIHPLETIVIV